MLRVLAEGLLAIPEFLVARTDGSGPTEYARAKFISAVRRIQAKAPLPPINPKKPFAILFHPQ